MANDKFRKMKSIGKLGKRRMADAAQDKIYREAPRKKGGRRDRRMDN